MWFILRMTHCFDTSHDLLISEVQCHRQSTDSSRTRWYELAVTAGMSSSGVAVATSAADQKSFLRHAPTSDDGYLRSDNFMLQQLPWQLQQLCAKFAITAAGTSSQRDSIWNLCVYADDGISGVVRARKGPRLHAANVRPWTGARSTGRPHQLMLLLLIEKWVTSASRCMTWYRHQADVTDYMKHATPPSVRQRWKLLPVQRRQPKN